MTMQPVPRAMRELYSSIEQGNPPDMLDVVYDETAPPLERMNAIRPELYKVTGLVLPFAVERFIGRLSVHPPFGVEAGREPRTFGALDSVHMDHAEEAVRGITRTIPGEEYVPVVNRYISLVAQYHAIRPKQEHTANAQVFLQAGLGTAVEMSLGALSGINSLVHAERPETTRDEFLGIARRSSRLVTNIAANNIDRISALRSVLKRDGVSLGFETNNLMLTERADGPYVDYRQPLANFVDPRHGKRIGEIGLDLTTIGCPALYYLKPGIESSAKAMWNQVSETVAVMLYPE